ncbi:hypothetical protein N7457_002530 [Penicillium paradoxum]|uniref:uncharacterized protein n=1 Tax=Penicillium paradoxum TaxID=176176 RepID=UPI0025478513|nr:uncharacterized protein N7457_002530 [Penicillium paradoxum]KAJ5787540.1 hypothetical protein N7457_002530 [Penicillium paradoxum]
MSSNRPFLSNFLAAFRAQSTYKATTQQVGTSTISSTQISQNARTIATKAANAAQGSSASASASSSTPHHAHTHNHHTHSSPTSSSTSSPTSGSASGPVQGPSPAPAHHYHHDQASSPPTSTPIPINRSSADRQRRGSDSSSGSGGFRDAIGPEKWYIGGRTPAGEERFYRLGMVTKGGGRLGGSGRVGSIDQLSL